MNDAQGSPWTRLVQRIAPRLKYPHLFLATLALFLLDLAIPDPIPFVDEILLALLTVLFGLVRSRTPEETEPEEPPRDVTPPQ